MDDRENAWVDLGLSHRLWYTPDDPYDTDSRFINDILDARMLALLHGRAQGCVVEFVGTGRWWPARSRTHPMWRVW